MSDKADPGGSPEIVSLLEGEARDYPEDLVLKQQVLSHLEFATALATDPWAAGTESTALPPTVGGPSVEGAAASVGAGGLTAKALALASGATFVLGLAIGGTIVHRREGGVDSKTNPPAPVTIVAPVPSAAPEVSLSVTTALSPPRPATATPAPRIVRPLKTELPNSEVTELARERELIDAAQSALAHDRPNDALVALDRHANNFPKGNLAEEREALRVRAFMATGRETEARAAAMHFEQTFPESVLAPRVKNSVKRSVREVDAGRP